MQEEYYGVGKCVCDIHEGCDYEDDEAVEQANHLRIDPNKTDRTRFMDSSNINRAFRRLQAGLNPVELKCISTQFNLST